MPSNFDYSVFLTDDNQSSNSGFDYSTLLSDSGGTKVGKAVQRVGDAAISLGKGVIGAPQAIAGIADLVTGGEAGKSLEDAGVRFKDAQDILSGLQSPEQKAANAEVSNADGFIDTTKSAINNPSTIINSVAESLPAMGVGGVVARGGIGAAGLLSRGLAEKAVPVMAGLGEGAVTAGQIAEQVRSENPDKLLTNKQAIAATGAGIVTGGIGAAAAKLVNTKFGRMLGLSDVDVLIAKGGPDAVTAGAAKTGFIKSLLSSGFSEGVLEELPQSAQEQMWQNYAQGKPVMEGVGNAAATGMLAGAAMGGAGGGYNNVIGQVSRENPDYPPKIDQEASIDLSTSQEQANGDSQLQQTKNNQGLYDGALVQPIDGQAGVEVSSPEDAVTRLSELEIQSQNGGLTPEQQAEYAGLAKTINQEASDQPNQAGIEAQAAEPQVEPISEVQPAEIPVSSIADFQPTHQLYDGTPVKLTADFDGNPVFEDAQGNWTDFDNTAEPINEQSQNTATQARTTKEALNDPAAQAETGQAEPVPSNAGTNPVGNAAPAGSDTQQSDVPEQGDAAQTEWTQSLSDQVSQRFNGADVSDVVVDDEFGNVTATINGIKGVDAGFVEDYQRPLLDTPETRFAAYQEKFPQASDNVTEVLKKAAEAKSKPVRDSYLREAEKLHGETKPAKPAKNNLTAPPTGNEELQSAIRKLGGIKREISDRSGFTDFKGRKYTGLFNNGKNAKTFDEMAEVLRDYGYQVDGENDLIEKLYSSLNGNPHYSPAGAEQYAAKLAEEATKAEQGQLDSDSAMEAAEERAAIQAADELPPDEFDDIIEAVFANDKRNTGTITNLDDIFGPETGGAEESAGTADTKTTVRRTDKGGAKTGSDSKVDGQGAEQQRPKSESSNEKSNQANEQAGSGISEKAQRAAELFKVNPQKVVNDLTARGAIKPLFDAAGVMTSAAFKDLPLADKVAAYVKMTIGETIPGAPKPKGKPVETDLFVNSEEERKALEAKQGAANVAAAKDKKRQGDGAEPPPLFSDNAAMAGQVDIADIQTEEQILESKKQVIAQAIAKEIIRQQNLSDKAKREGKKQPKESDRVKLAATFGIASEGWGPFDMAFGTGLNAMTQAKLKMDGSRATEAEIVTAVIDYIDSIKTQSSNGQANPGSGTVKTLSKSEVREGDLVESDNFILKITKFPSLKKSDGGFQSVDFRIIKTKDKNGKWTDYQGKPRNETVGAFVHQFGVYPVTGEVPEKSTGEVDQAALDADRFKDNKIFTADKVAAARERLKAKLGTLNSGFDPELALDGMTIAGAYIESGIKAYADYTKAMVADLGEGVRPYLRSFYESVRAYPGMDKTGMTSHAELEAADRYKIHHGEMWSFDGQPAREVTLVNEHYIGFKTKDDAGKFNVSVGNFSQQKDRWQKVTDVTANPDKSAITKPGQSKDNAKFNEAQDYAKRPQDAEQAPAETGNSEKDRSPWGDSQPDSGQVDSGLAETNQEARNTGSADSGSQKTSGTRAGSGRVRAPKQLDGRNRGKANSGDRSESGTTKPDSVSLPSEPKADFTATAETAEAITEGGQKTKARANIAAIKLVKQLVAEDRRATMEEQKALARYVGWGGIKQIFDEDNSAWSSLRTELKNILTAEEYAAANRSILDAHYTGLDVVNGMWGIAKHLGFKGGRLLEPSMGVGNFFGAMPHDMRVNSTMFGVELDNITGAIAKYLYPNARINAPVGFQDVVIPSNSFDFATGNPPFGEHSLYDKDHPEFRSFAIHQFFFAKTLDKLRPGGIQAFVVSRYLMDSRDGNGMAARKYLSENARLVGAMRLPYNAFLSNANTEVVTDIIILQKLAEGEKGNADEWTSMTDINVVHPDGTPSTFAINKYFADHPEMVLGTHSNTGKMRAKYQYNVEPIPGESLQYGIEKATKYLPKDIYQSAEKPLVELATQADEVPEGTKVYGFFMDGDKVMQRVPDSMGNRQAVEVAFKDTKAPQRAKGLIKIRDALRDLMRSELSRTADNAELEAKRAKLNQVYDDFVKEFSFVNRDVNRRVMRDDPDYPLLESLEPNYDQGLGAAAAKARGEKERKPTADKADIFRERVLYPFQTLSKAETAKDALIASLNEKGGIDQDFMAEIYSKPWESIEAELGDLIYQNPAGGYETADAYLSGNVKAKLKLAETSAKENPAFQRNVDALKAVQPADIPALKISVRLGSPWVDSAAMAEFAKEIFGKRTNASIRFVPQIAKWMVSIEDFDPVARVSVWGTQRMPANELLEHILNNKPIVVKDNLGTSREPQWVVNETETESARAKAQDMSAKFKEWIWQDQDRRDRLAKIYNQNYNTDRRRNYDGSHLTLPGSSNTIQLRPHQKNAIWRALQDRTILLDQVVGAGKTFIMAGIAMEMRRLGIARKPMFMVPNSLVRQWRDEFYKLYPNANVLAATENDFAKVNRKRFMAKIATGDWDAVVVAHSSFKKIGMPEVQERKILDDQLKEIADAIEDMKRERGDKNVMRDMQRIKEKLEQKLNALNDRGGKKDDTVSFDELGVDALFTDEAHCFPHDTVVTTDKGQLKIGDIVEKEIEANVISLNLSTNVLEWKPIIARYNNPVTDRLVKIDHEHGSFTCTANHKIWVNNEYIQAGDIKPGDRVTVHRKSLERNSKQVLLEEVCDQELRSVRGGVQVQIFGEHEQCEAQSLFEQVRGNMENDSREHKVSDCSGSFGRAEESGSEETWYKMPGIIRSNDRKQSDEEPGIQREDAPKAVGEDFLSKGREWKDNSTTGNNQQCALLADGACHYYVGSDESIRVDSVELQSGFGARGNENSNRDRWEITQDEESANVGSKENCGPECSRVVSVTFLEQGSRRESAGGYRKDQRVYCIEVGENHNFFADGVLVSNCFKNLFYISGMRNIAGLGNPSGSGRAFDLFVKTQFLAENYAGKAPIVFATGTPVSNSLVEMFTMQRYLAWSKLKDANIHLLDAWAGVYGDVQNVYEVHPSGTGYRLSTRFAKFVNLPSLMNLYRSFADIITMDDLKKQAIDRGEKFPVPKIKGGKPTLVVAPRSDLQTRFFGEPEFLYNEDGSIRFKYGDAPNTYEAAVDGSGKWSVTKTDTKGSVSKKYDTKEEAEEDLQRGLVTPEVAWNENSILWKFENLKRLTKETNGKINALSITNEARKAGLDYRLINPAAPDFKDSKVNKAVDNVLRIYKAWNKDKGTQLVFCDLSVPQSAKAAAASTERDAFVRREDGELKKVKATIAQIDGMDRAFLVVKMGKKEETRFMVYDGVTGADLEIEGATRAEAVKALTDASNNDLSFADKFEQFSPIEDSDIADWKDANNDEGEDDEEGDGAISMDELLSMGSTNKFSVYDDIKAKLIKKGIPEKEIAFIHDYNTAVKKGKLFDLVNAGEIRVLIGSTEKMGAGMNVQKRLVGLHHLDAPWRPSDLEQREGRIIRQGNELYKRDPDNFEVEIMRYGTKQTYDTRMWQIIEHKASGVEQLRKANDDMLEIDDVGGEAANAADMKAAASGNPLILDEIKLRNEVKSLEAQQFGHMQAQVELQDKLKTYKNAPQAEREKMAGIQPVIDVRDANPAKPFRFVDSDGIPHEEYKEAEAPLTKAMIAAAKGGYGKEVDAGKYRGLNVTFERGHFGVSVVLSTKGGEVLEASYYGPDDKFSVTGLVSRLDNALSKLDDQVNRLKKETQDKLEQIPTIEKELGKPFAKEDQLKEARAKHRSVVNQLAKSGGGIELTDAMKKELDAALAARGLSDTRLSIGANTAPTPSLVDLFEKMGKRSSKSAAIDHPQADLIRAIQDGGWQDVLLQVGYEKADKSDNPNGKVFIQC